MSERDSLLSTPRDRQGSSTQNLENISNLWATARNAIKRTFTVSVRENDDLVSISTRSFCFYITISVSLWLLSFILICLQIIEHDRFRNNVLLFIPMWLGSLLGILSVICTVYKTLSNTIIVSRERRLFMRAQGLGYSGKVIEKESLPLLRMLVGWASIAVLSCLFAFISQVLFYLWFVHCLIGIGHALVPIGIMVALYLPFVYILEFFSVVSCVVLSLLAVSFALFSLKVGGGLHSVDWAVVTIPQVGVLLIAYRYIVDLLYRVFLTGYLRLSAVQTRALYIYLVALLFATASLVRSVAHMHSHESTYGGGNDLDVDTHASSPSLPRLDPLALFFFMMTGTLVIQAGLLVFNEEMVLMTLSRGYKEPTPLKRTDKGWEAALGADAEKDLWWPMLGRLTTTPPSLRTIALRSSVDSPVYQYGKLEKQCTGIEPLPDAQAGQDGGWRPHRGGGSNRASSSSIVNSNSSSSASSSSSSSGSRGGRSSSGIVNSSSSSRAVVPGTAAYGSIEMLTMKSNSDR